MSWTYITKTASTFVKLFKRGLSFLLCEDGGYLLLEDGDRIILDLGTEWLNGTKNSSTFTNSIKN